MMITVIGNLVADAEPRVASGYNLTRLRVASNERIKDANGEWKDGDTTYIDVTCWRKLAEGAAQLKRGQRVVVQGKLKGRSYQTNDGRNAYGYEIEATDIGLSVMPRGSSEAKTTKDVKPDLDNPWGEN